MKFLIYMPGTGIIAILIVCLLSACAYQKPVTIVVPPQAGGTTAQVQYWWHVNYRIQWPENTEPKFYIDLLLADAVIEPILLKYRDSITYWRFHRRAIRDKGGHEFSFIFYTDKTTARNIYRQVKTNGITKKMLMMNILQRINVDNPEKNTLTDVNATSDKNWPLELQNAWPAYIMGASNTWLQLIDQEVKDNKEDNDINHLLEIYRQADASISKLWFEQGQHAFLHHLNAIFGYKPILINKEPLRF